jgi:MFS family permease
MLVSLVLLGAGAGMTFVALTSASLEDVAPAVAGAASGLVNVSQQLGAAVGLAVLVTVFNAAGGTHLGSRTSVASGIAHPLDVVFGIGALFALASFAAVLFGVRGTRGPSPALAEDADEEPPDEALVSSIGAGRVALESPDYAHSA